MSLVGSWSVVEQFEHRVAEYVGADHVVAVDTCTAGLFLSLKYVSKLHTRDDVATLPDRTYLGVACAAVHAGYKLHLARGLEWSGAYAVGFTKDHAVLDSACRLYHNCFVEAGELAPQDLLMCFSFQYRKHLKIGRGGAVATDDRDAADWLRKARFCGRSDHGGVPEFVGWHAFMEPERAARGLVLMDSLPSLNSDLTFEYPDLSTYDCLKEHLA